MGFDKVSLDRPTCLILSTAAFCLLLTVVAVKASDAQADPQRQPEIINASIPQPAAEQQHPGQTMIKDQLTAIKARNADLAFSYLSDHMHENYDTAKEYLSEMRFEYRPIYNYESFEFLDSHTSGESLVQKVSFVDSYTKDEFTAIYRLVKSEDGHWKIDSFAVLEQDSSPI